MQIITSETITSKQRSKLKSLASNLQPVTQIGKGGISDNLLKTLSDALEAHELIKVSILSNAEEDAGNLAENVAELLDAVPVAVIGRKAIFFIVVVLLTISLPGSIPATYKLYSDLNMRNSYLFLIGCTAGFGANFLIFMGFWRSIDWAYAEAAYIDGANEWQVFVKVMVPQGLPIMGVSIINGFIAQWLSADPSMLYLPEMPSLGYGLWVYQQRSAGGMNYPVFFAALIVVAIPSIVAFICLHDKTIKAMNLGGLKG